MKSLKVLLAMLVLAVAVVGCRTVPMDVLSAHVNSMIRSTDATFIAKDIMLQIEDKSTELNDASVSLAFAKWTENVETIMAKRSIVHKYLLDTKADLEVSSAYSTGHKLLVDMHAGFHSISRYWENMITDEMTAPRTEFIKRFRKDIERFKVLERKFDEWISQFKVKG